MQKNKTMKEMPEVLQPYEKCRKEGPEALSDAELLAAVLRTGSPGETSLLLAHRLLMACPDTGLPGVFSLTFRQLQELKGMGPVKAVQLQCVGELSRRIAKASTRQALRMDMPETIAGHYMEQMRHLRQEQMILLTMNSKLELIRETLISKGTVNASMITPREVFLEALRQEAVFIILLHNHPSGDPAPSEEDLLVTKRFSIVGELLNIPLTDHIIIGNQQYFSMKEQGMIT